MRKTSGATKSLIRAVSRSERRSALFWWMKDHHDQLLQASLIERFDWAQFCAEASRRGLTDTRGRPSTERNARETWRQVRIAVAKALERLAGELKRPPIGGKYPSRMPKGWQPEEVSSAPAPTAKPPAPWPAAPASARSVAAGNQDAVRTTDSDAVRTGGGETGKHYSEVPPTEWSEEQKKQHLADQMASLFDDLKEDDGKRFRFAGL